VIYRPRGATGLPVLVLTPPALVITAEHDPLHDESRRYAQRLRAEGTPVRYTDDVGMVHGFMSFPGLASGARQALAEMCHELADAFGVEPDRWAWWRSVTVAERTTEAADQLAVRARIGAFEVGELAQQAVDVRSGQVGAHRLAAEVGLGPFDVGTQLGQRVDS